MNLSISVIVLLALALLGCSQQENKNVETSEVPEVKPFKPYNPHEGWDRPEEWLAVMQIWRCDDGTFEVRTSYSSEGKFATEEQARVAKTNWALGMVEAFKEGRLESRLPTLPDCGKRIE